MAHYDAAFPSKYLKAGDLGESGAVVTISRMAVEPVGQNKEIKPVLYFAGKEKGMVLNKTNAKKIASLVGSADMDDWTGKTIRLYASETEFNGDTVECIRVKAAGATKAAETVPADDTDIPF